jgi:hypothetical protein
MWEAVAAPGRLEELLAWAMQQATLQADLYRGADDRVVVIDPTGVGLPDPPDELIARAPHAWDFDPIHRG